MAVAYEWSSVLIVEDDLDLDLDFAERWRSCRPAVARGGWGFFYGGYLKPGKMVSILRSIDPGIVVVPPNVGLMGSHVLAIRQPHLSRLVAYLEDMLVRPPCDPAGGPMHVDGAYAWYRAALHPDAGTLAALPVLGHQRPSRTDIHALKWFDRTPRFRLAAGMLRRLRRLW